MIEFEGVYYDGRTSARKPVRVRGYTLAIQIVGEGLRLDVPLAKVRVDPPVGGTRRALHRPDGAQLQTDDHRAVEALFPRPHAIEGWVHRLWDTHPPLEQRIAILEQLAHSKTDA